MSADPICPFLNAARKSAAPSTLGAIGDGGGAGLWLRTNGVNTDGGCCKSN